MGLGFLNFIWSLQYQEAPTSIDELVSYLVCTFYALKHGKLNYAFLSCQCTFDSGMGAGGSDNYKLQVT